MMGVPDSYKLPGNYNHAYALMGDGVVVPVVRHLAHFLIEPILISRPTPHTSAAFVEPATTGK